jgi:hypothetical protein
MRTFWWVGVALLGAGAVPGAAQSAPSLTVAGLETGVERGQLESRVAELGGRLECKGSAVDRRFAECSAVLKRAPDGRHWNLLASMVDGNAAILLLTAPFDAPRLTAFREELTQALGRPNLNSRGGQDSFEWVRAGRMLRLTSRHQGGRLEVAVSLVEGRLLDQLTPTTE